MEKSISIDELDIKLRSHIFLTKNGLMTLSTLCTKLDEGIDALLELPFCTAKVAVDLLKAVKPYGYRSESLAEEYLAAHKTGGTLPAETLKLWEDMLQTINN